MCRTSASLADVEQLDIVSEVVAYLHEEAARLNEMRVIKNQLADGWKGSAFGSML